MFLTYRVHNFNFFQILLIFICMAVLTCHAGVIVAPGLVATGVIAPVRTVAYGVPVGVGHGFIG